MRTIRYQEIADELRERVAHGRPPGRVLPSGGRAVRRVRASAGSRSGGRWSSLRDGRADRRPPGVRLVRGHRARAADARSLGTIESQLEAAASLPERQIDRVRLRDGARTGCAELLDATRCCGSSGSTSPTANRSPWSRCGARPSSAPDLSRDDVERRPFYELLDVALRGATQTIGADRVDAADAPAARRPARLAGAALRAGHHRPARQRPCCVSEHIFPAHRTEFVVELPQAEPSMTPSGLRIVD